MSNITIKTDRFDVDRRRGNGSLHVFVEDSECDKLVKDWFNKNEIWSLKVKSKAWTSIAGKLKRLNETLIAVHFEVPVDNVHWSRTACCSCGCSPCFVVKNPPQKYIRHNVWVNIKSPQVYVRIIKDKIAKAVPKLQEDLEAHFIEVLSQTA